MPDATHRPLGADTAISVENLSKRYRLGRIGATSLRESLEAWWAGVRGRRQAGAKALTDEEKWREQDRQARADNTGSDAPEDLWALRDVSFDVPRGQVLGIIGKNGAGKSTLLKILTRITEPTAGRAVIRGRVSSLLEVGTGFHGQLSGRENVYLSGATLGMKKSEIDRKYDDIVQFAEIERFMDTPVKRYSSWMYVRLAFAVAAHLEPEILLVDEVLAVGDAAFQQKCLGRMNEVSEHGRTILFVSHNMSAIQSLCSRAILLEHGACVLDSDPATAVARYLSARRGYESTVTFPEDPERDMRIVRMAICDAEGRPVETCPHTQPFQLEIEYRVDRWRPGSLVCCDVFNDRDNRLVWSSDARTSEELVRERRPGLYRARVEIPGDLLYPGRYFFSGALYAPGRSRAFDFKEKVLSMEVTDGGSLLSSFGIKIPAITMLPLTWRTECLEAS